MVPLEVNPFGSATGAVLLPAGLRGSDLVADITDQPGQLWRSAAVRTTQRAVRLGRDACRAERHGQRQSAETRWIMAGDTWDDVGDDRRAELARRYADGAGAIGSDPRVRRGSVPRRPLLEPVVLDLLGPDPDNR